MKAAFFCDRPETVDSVYGDGRKEAVAALTDLYPEIITSENLAQHLPHLHDLEVIFSTWGMLVPTDEQFEAMPNLKCVFYAASSVRRFAEPFLRRGIQVMTAGVANGTSVAEFTLAQILLANKGYFQNARAATSLKNRSNWPRQLYTGNFEQSVSLLGAGMIGRKVIELLRPFALNVRVYDPFLSEEEARVLGVEKVDLLTAFASSSVVSNHVANLPETQGIFRREHFASMQLGATFINTGRGAQIVESEMIEVLRNRPDLTALLDVTFPEPPVEGSPLYELPNVFLSNHIAGAYAHELWRMADFCLEECERFGRGEPLRWGVTLERLKHMA